MNALRPYQHAAIAKFFSKPNKRLILAHATGSGKTRVALEIARALEAKSVLVVGSAQSRGTWIHEARRWLPEVPFQSILYGPANKSLTKKQHAQRAASYASPYQVVSYSLLKHLLGTGPRDLIVFDEAHALRAPLSQQSRVAKLFMRSLPKVPALLLTATPIPTEVMNLWNLVDTLFPSLLGVEAATGDVSWSFKNKYCQCELREWPGGSARYYFGANEENLPELAKRLEPIQHCVSSAEVAQYAPPLNANILWVDEPGVTDADIASDWLDAREADESTHVGLFSWTHKVAEELKDAARNKGWEPVLVTGRMSPEQRQAALDLARRAAKACIVGTAGALAESISLSFIKQALVFEWRATPGQAVQFSGRFARQDSTSPAPTYLLYVARTDDEREANILRQRLEAVSQLYQQDARAEQLQAIMAPRELTESHLALLCQNMFGEVRASFGLQEDDE